MTISNATTTRPKHKARPSFVCDAANFHALLKAAALWASADETRADINSVHVEACGGRLKVISTNGHALYIGGVQCSEDGFQGQITLSLKTVASLVSLTKSFTKKRAALELVTFDGERLMAKIGDVVVALQQVSSEMEFPPYERVIPSGPPDGLKDGFVGLSLQYLGMVSKTFPAKDGVTVETRGDELTPVVFRGETVAGETATLVLMPMRI